MKYIFLFITIISFVTSSRLEAQCTNEGREFYVVFPSSYPGLVPTLRLYLTTRERNTIVQVQYGINTTQTVFVNVGAVTTVTLPVNPCHLTKNRTIDSQAGIYVRSTDSTKFSLYGINRINATTDAFTGIPREGLGTNYLIASYYRSTDPLDGKPETAVVATEDSTVVTFDIPGVFPNPTTVTLKRRQAYLLQDTMDLTGGSIISNKPVAVFSGSQCAYVPYDVQACDHLVEQLLPVPSWGTLFYISPFQDRDSGDVYRMIASEDGTQIYLDGALLGSIDRGEFLEGDIRDSPSEIFATKPIQVAQYAKSLQADGPFAQWGDPFMIMIPPTDLFLDGYNFTTPAFTNQFGQDAYPRKWLTIVAPVNYTANVRLDGNPVTAAWTAIPNSNGTLQYATANIFLTTNASHSVSYSPLPPERDRYTLSGYIYGWGFYDSYGYAASFGVRPQLTYTLKPDTIDLGFNYVDSASQGTAQFQNKSALTIRAAGAYFTPATLPATVTTTFPQNVAPGQPLDIAFTATAREEKEYQGMLCVRIDSPCVNAETCVPVRFAGKPRTTLCINTNATSALTPGQTTMLPIILGPTTLIPNTQTVSVRFSYTSELLRLTGKATSSYGTLSPLTIDNATGDCSFTFTANQPLPADEATIAEIEVEALLATKRNGTITVEPALVTMQSNQQITASGCPADFSISESCVKPAQLRARNTTKISALYPNPSHESFSLAVSSSLAVQVELEIVDIFGRTMEKSQHIITKGETKLTVSTSRYSSGVYFLRFHGNEENETRIFTVDR